MEARHQADPAHLWHFSEDPAIDRFTPHVPTTNPEQPPMVWTIDEVHAPLFWFPRDCPRITFWTEDGSPPDALGATTASRVHAIEASWLARVRACELWVYRFAVDGFEPWPAADGYWVSGHEHVPLDVSRVGDLLERHRERGIDLRVLPDLRELRDQVIASGYRFSMCRMANLESPLNPAPGGASGTG
jgi:hypothetical protein